MPELLERRDPLPWSGFAVDPLTLIQRWETVILIGTGDGSLVVPLANRAAWLTVFEPAAEQLAALHQAIIMVNLYNVCARPVPFDRQGLEPHDWAIVLDRWLLPDGDAELKGLADRVIYPEPSVQRSLL